MVVYSDNNEIKDYRSYARHTDFNIVESASFPFKSSDFTYIDEMKGISETTYDNLDDIYKNYDYAINCGHLKLDGESYSQYPNVSKYSQIPPSLFILGDIKFSYTDSEGSPVDVDKQYGLSLDIMFRAVDDNSYYNNWWTGQYMNSYQVFYGDKSIADFDESVNDVFPKVPDVTVKVGDSDDNLDVWNKNMGTDVWNKNDEFKTNNIGIFLTNPDDTPSNDTVYPYAMSNIEATYLSGSNMEANDLLKAMKADGANYIMTKAIEYDSSLVSRNKKLN